MVVSWITKNTRRVDCSNWKTYFTTEKDSVMDDVFFIYSVITEEGKE